MVFWVSKLRIPNRGSPLNSFLIHFLKLNDRNYEITILYHVFSTHIDMQTLMYLTIFYIYIFLRKDYFLYNIKEKI